MDDTVRDQLKQRAADDGVSLNTLLRELLTREAAVPSRRSVIARLNERGDLIDRPALEILADARREHTRRLPAQ